LLLYFAYCEIGGMAEVGIFVPDSEFFYLT